MIRLICGVAALVAVAGCAPIQPPQPTADHPASPRADQAEYAELSNVLAIDERNLPQTPPEMRRDMMHHGHETMDDGMRGGGSPENDQSGRYTCAMHPEVVAEAPGKCPMCGVQLVPKGGPEDE